jgi:Inner membrane component of T3SS, cytoplasmic domain
LQPWKKTMSFRLFIYYCAICGAWAAFVGWLFGRGAPISHEDHPYILEGLKAFLLGLTVALALGLVDAIWNVPLNRHATIALRGLTAVVIGGVGALVSGVVGEFFQQQTQNVALIAAVFFVLAWTITGLLIGVSLGAFETVTSLASGKDLRGAMRKAANGAIGGALGGFLGGLLAFTLRVILTTFFAASQGEREPLTPSAWGFVILGLCIGLLIGLTQVILKDAWVKVESGFRAGRELMLTKDETTIGRAETCDLGLFGDNTIERLHASIKRVNNRFILLDAESTSGTYVNDQRVSQPTPLCAGDAIRVGRSVLRFGERAKHHQ